MRLSVFTRIFIAALLPAVLVLLACVTVIVNILNKAGEADALRVMENCTVLAKDNAVNEIFHMHAENASADLKEIEALLCGALSSYPMPAGGNLLLLSGNGMVIYSDTLEFIGESLVSLVFKNNHMQTAEKLSAFIKASFDDGVMISKYNSIFPRGKSYMGVAYVSPDFFIFIDVPAQMLTAPYGSWILMIVFVAAAGVAFTCAAGFITARGVSDPIRRLSGIAEKAAENGLFDASDALRRYPFKDEIRALGEALEKTVSDINLVNNLTVSDLRNKIEQEKLNTSGNAKMSFFSDISHEIRTPMNSILGLTQILTADSELSQTHKKYISDIKTSAESLTSLITDILDLSMLESGKIALAMRDYNFPKLVDDISSFARAAAEQKGLEYIFNFVGKPPACLYGDDVKLHKAVTGLIQNAAKLIGTGFISLKVIINEETVVFEIRDTGKGIKRELLAGVFDAYNQPEQLLPGQNMLGFPISKKLIDLIGGNINVNSEYGVGSVFMVEVPKTLGERDNLKFPGVKSDLYFSGEARALIVDDNEINLMVAEGLVSSMYGIASDMALSGKEAIDLVADNKYDIIFMDHMMPEMDGVETMHRIRAMGGSRAIVPVIALTANADDDTRGLLIKEGMNDFLSKPLMINELCSVLQKWMPKEKRIQKDGAAPEPEKPEMSPVVTAVMNIPEFDVDAGLKNVASKEAVYEKSLNLLRKKIPKVNPIMEQCLKEDNLPEFTIHVHGMKGSLSTVGANELSKLALELEKAGKNGDADFCKNNLPNLINQLCRLEEQLAPIFEDEEADQKQPGSRAAFVKHFNTLTEAAENYSYDVILNTVAKMTGFSFGDSIDEKIMKIKDLIDVFDYDGINEVIGEIKFMIDNDLTLFEGM